MESNRRRANMLKHLPEEEDVQATSGKIFLCGNPGQGKTTLRKSLQNDLPPYVNIWARERRPHDEPRTREIQVSYIVNKGEHGEEPVTISVWDLAGQFEYEILQSAFLPDLAFADGHATTFVIVCNAKLESGLYRPSQAGSNGMGVLNYWMRFIASSSSKGVDKRKRHILLVLNRFEDEQCDCLEQWEDYPEELRMEFQEYLEIQKTPFVVDVARSVKELKELNEMNEMFFQLFH